MNEHPISVQIGRLIGNLLAGEGAVYLPSVGSLHVVRRGARRISKRQVQPPGSEAVFSSEVYGRALPEVIAGEIGGDGARAQEIYETWLAQSRTGEVLTILGVGTLQEGRFQAEAEFDRRLNPQGAAPVQLKRFYRFDWALACGLLAIIAAVGFGGYHFLQHYADDAQQPERKVLAESEALSDPEEGQQNVLSDLPGSRPQLRLQPQPQPQSQSQSRPQLRPLPQPKPHQQPQSESESDAQPNLRLQPQPQPEPASQPEPEPQSQTKPESAAKPAPATASSPASTPAAEVRGEQRAASAANLASGRQYVVLGVYSTIDNARRACEKMAEQIDGLRCSIYRFGEKFLISPFSSEEEGACQDYAREQRETFPDAWVYTAR